MLGFPAIPESIPTRQTSRQAPVLAAYCEYTPKTLQPAIATAAAVFLTPWLYVMMLFVFVVERWIPADPSQRVLRRGHDSGLCSAWFTLDGLVRIAVIGTLVGTLYPLYHNHLAFLTLCIPRPIGRRG